MGKPAHVLLSYGEAGVVDCYRMLRLNAHAPLSYADYKKLIRKPSKSLFDWFAQAACTFPTKHRKTIHG